MSPALVPGEFGQESAQALIRKKAQQNMEQTQASIASVKHSHKLTSFEVSLDLKC